MRMLLSPRWCAISLSMALLSGCCGATRERDPSTVQAGPLPQPCLAIPPPPSPDPTIFLNPATQINQLAHRIEVLEIYARQAWLLCGAR